MYMQKGASFTGRQGTVYAANVPTDFPPEDIGLAHRNGWLSVSVNSFPGVLDVPQYGVPGSRDTIPQAKLAQVAVPFVLASSGSMANNGALSGLAALPATFSNGCYIYLPASAIFAGSTAGWYFAIMSSATAGTVYNIPYTSGQPWVPATPAQYAFASTGPGAFTGVSTQIAGPSFTLPANLMGPHGVLELAAVYGCAGSVNSKMVGIKLGSATIYAQTTTTAANVAALALLTCQNQGLTNAQVSNQTGSVGFSATGQTYSAVDTTQNQTLSMVGTKVAAENLIFDAFSATVTPG